MLWVAVTVTLAVVSVSVYLYVEWRGSSRRRDKRD